MLREEIAIGTYNPWATSFIISSHVPSHGSGNLAKFANASISASRPVGTTIHPETIAIPPSALHDARAEQGRKQDAKRRALCERKRRARDRRGHYLVPGISLFLDVRTLYPAALCETRHVLIY